MIGGCFLTTASHGTEQLMVQRLLSAKNESESRAALFSSWFVILFQFTLFLMIGVCLFVYYTGLGTAAARSPRPHLPGVHLESPAARHRRTGDRRDSGCRDVEPQRRAEQPGVHHDHGFLQADGAAIARKRTTCVWPAGATVVWGVVLFAIALVARNWGSVLAGRTVHRLDSLRIAAGRIPAGTADAARRRGERPWPACRRACW